MGQITERVYPPQRQGDLMQSRFRCGRIYQKSGSKAPSFYSSPKWVVGGGAPGRPPHHTGQGSRPRDKKQRAPRGGCMFGALHGRQKLGRSPREYLRPVFARTQNGGIDLP